MTKKKILVFVDWYLPGYKAGGQIRSVASMVGHLKDHYDFSIITSDSDLHADAPYERIPSDTWVTREDGSKVYYFSTANKTKEQLKKVIFAEQADIIYLNSLFSVFYTLQPLLIRKKFLPNRKLVLAPRGMLGNGALKIKPIKKKLFLNFAKILGLYKGITWHASSEAEADEIRAMFGKNCKIHVAIDLVESRQLTKIDRAKTPGKLKAAFLSRISVKKNLEGTIKLLGKLPSTCDVEFDIYGPIEDPEYWKRCDEAISKLPSNIKANYKGVIENSKVISVLSNYHLSILLTFNENYGHSIVESMAAGCPVLLSDQTIWKELEQKNAGWDIPLSNEEEILKALITACNWDQQLFDKISDGALLFANSIFNDEKGIEQNRLLFA
jgi:glycosyltransferase involved in cell wall biosynthesis